MTRLPAEYRGLARLFRDRVVTVDRAVGRAVDSVVAPLQARLRTHRALRADQAWAACYEWRRRVPCAYRLGEIEMERGTKRLTIRETRISAQRMIVPGWDGDEIGVGIVTLGVDVANGVARPVIQSRAVVSLHALGRRIERGDNGDDAAVIADLARLVGAEGLGGGRIGNWLGRDATVKTRGAEAEILNVRTWVADGVR